MPPRPWPAVLADAAAVCGATAADSNHERFVVMQLAACERVLGTSSGNLVDTFLLEMLPSRTCKTRSYWQY